MLDLIDFALQEQPEENLLVAISWAWYNGSYTMATKPIKSLELHIIHDPVFVIIIYLGLTPKKIFILQEAHL